MDRYDPYTDKFLRDTQYDILSTNLASLGTDLISRQAAIDYFVINVGFHDEDGYPIEDTDELRKIWTEYFDGIPSAEPKRGEWIDKGITGDWQYQTDGRGRSWHEWQCDQCKDMVKKRSFYCPNCGADMREVTT